MTALQIVGDSRRRRSDPGTSGTLKTAVSGRRVAIDSIPDQAWDPALVRFSDTSLEQCAAYARGRWGSGHDSHLIINDVDGPVAMARVAVYVTPLISRGLAFVKFGPVWRIAGFQPDPGVYRHVLTELREEYCHRRALLLSVQPRPHPTDQPIEERILEEEGFVARRTMPSPDRFFVDLRLNEEDQRQSLGQKWRYNLKKAERAGVTVGCEVGASGFDLFRRMHREMVRRKEAADSDPLHLLPALADQLPPSSKPTTVIARHEGEPVAGAIVATFGDTAYYLYGASRDQALKLNAGYALQWWIARWLSAGSARWYDLGGAPESSALRQFKAGLTGKTGQIVPQLGERDYWVRPDHRIAADAMFQLRGAAKTVRRRLQRFVDL